MDLGLSWIEWLWFPEDPNLDLVTVVPPGPHRDEVTGTQGPHLDLVTQVLIWASRDLVSQFHIGASSGPRDSGPPLGLTLTW